VNKPQAYNPYLGVIRGFYYEVKTYNSIFVFWYGSKIPRSELRQIGLEYIGPAYDESDIVSVKMLGNKSLDRSI
jgi:mRNA degradation ribonuclease J1/J2